MINEIYTKEFIDLAAKIQDEIEPEVGMWMMNGNDLAPHLIRNLRFESKTDAFGVTRSYYMLDYHECLTAQRENSILLPSLSWLMKKLREIDEPHNEIDIHYYPKSVILGVGHRYTNGERDGHCVCTDGPTLEYVCLRAFCRIKGIEL
ncbi:hypothetical protein M0R72_06340 [Candidatus Pacearchaeota archaeon]|jgi:hypothetical protein|nr:hypothetical protein [Candidatus Pacearchaeota archaeon]